MEFALVKFTDGILHVAPELDIKNRVGNQASVYWKKDRSFYLAEILEEGRKKEFLIELMKEYNKENIDADKSSPNNEPFRNLQTSETFTNNNIEKSLVLHDIPSHYLNESIMKGNTKNRKFEGAQDEPVFTRLQKGIMPGDTYQFALVRFTDGIFHVAPKTDIKKRRDKEASVYWKQNRTFYLATVLEEGQDKQALLELKKIYEKEALEMKSDDFVNMPQEVSTIFDEFDCCLPYIEKADDNKRENEEMEVLDENKRGKDSSEPLCEFSSSSQEDEEDISNNIPYEKTENGISDDDSESDEASEGSLESEDVFDSCHSLQETNSEDAEKENESIEQQVNFEEVYLEKNDIGFVSTMQGKETIQASMNPQECNSSAFLGTEGRNEKKINIISVHNILPPVSNRNRVKIIYPCKDQFCLFCDRTVKRFGRHLLNVHKKENDVAEILKYNAKSIERKKMINVLRTKFNYIYNHRENKTSQIVARRPINKRAPTEYTDCPTCLMRVSKLSLKRHNRRCNNEENVTGLRRTYIESKRVTLELHPTADKILRDHVFPNFRNDDCIKIIRNDFLVILYGNKMVAKYRSAHHYKMIRANIRYIGKFLLEMRELSSKIADFASCLTPCQYDNSVTAIKKVANFDEKNGEFKSPYTASTLGTILKFCSAILESHYIKEKNEKRRFEVEQFLKLLKTELTTDINKTAIENQAAIRRQKKVTLPTTSDIQKILKFLEEQGKLHQEKIKNKFTFDAWRALSECTLVAVMVYNGRRPGEIERITIRDWRESANSGEMQDNSEANTQTQYTRCLLRGKLGRSVPILLNMREMEIIRTILAHREMAGVDSENPYVFGLPSKRPFKFLNAGKLLGKYALEAGVDNPGNMFATNIRKNLATKSTKISLNPDDREHIMNFMGHSEKIHKGIYRQPDIDKDISIMPEILNFVAGNIEETSTAKLNNIFAIPTKQSELPLSLENDTEVCQTENNNDPKCKSYSNSDYALDESEEFTDEDYISPKKRRSRLIDMSLGYVRRRSWNTEERKSARIYFHSHISNGTIPSQEMCKTAVRECQFLKNRTPNQLKAWIHNEIKKYRNNTGSTKKTWTTPEKNICRREFNEEVTSGIYPRKEKIKRVLDIYPELSHRTPSMVIAHIQHAMKKSTGG